MGIKENLEMLNAEFPDNVRLVAVSKTKPNSDIVEALDAGHKIMGENKVQDLREKAAVLPKEIEWHFIGHLQSNKVKYIAPFVSMIHSIDSLKLLKEVNKQALRNDRTIDCLLQMHIATESTKFGLSEQELVELINSEEFRELKNVRIVGLMGMATFTSDNDQIRAEFKFLKEVFDRVKSGGFANNSTFLELSMGMSGDYSIAIEEGSTLVRIGSLIFGERS